VINWRKSNPPAPPSSLISRLYFPRERRCEDRRHERQRNLLAANLPRREGTETWPLPTIAARTAGIILAIHVAKGGGFTNCGGGSDVLPTVGTHPSVGVMRRDSGPATGQLTGLDPCPGGTHPEV
jgi:hypothetical protein